VYRVCCGDKSLQVNKVETATQKSQQALHLQQHEQEQHQRLVSVPFIVEDGASTSSSSLASSPVALSPVIELLQRSPSPCSLAGSSSSLRREQLRSIGSSSRFLLAAAASCPVCSHMHAGVPVAVGMDAPPRLSLLESKTSAHHALLISRQISRPALYPVDRMTLLVPVPPWLRTPTACGLMPCPLIVPFDRRHPQPAPAGAGAAASVAAAERLHGKKACNVTAPFTSQRQRMSCFITGLSHRHLTSPCRCLTVTFHVR
jgi:hypothetical protein